MPKPSAPGKAGVLSSAIAILVSNRRKAKHMFLMK
jgi:hypothetical protein